MNLQTKIYRPDIDGLRAIAVISVFLHHLSSSLLPGGFIGVDVFFVISGYLITGQIYKEADRREFSLAEFYKRRVSRIIPALLVVVVFSVLAGSMILSPADFVSLMKSTVHAMTGTSNIFFWRTYGNYFAENAAEAPLLHTWSLGVEEQFYVVWPLLVILLLKVKRRYRIPATLALFVGAVALSQKGLGVAASASYYLLPTRFFELLLGGILAIVVGNGISVSKRVSQYCSFIGIVLIGGSLALLGKDSQFPGVNALWPCLGTAFLIFGGATDGHALRMLSSRPMTFVGLISYSLYLWHWPIIAYVNYLGIPIDVTVGMLVIAAACCLAWMSWKYVEVPMRQSGAKLAAPRVFLVRFATPLIALFLVTGITAYSGGFPTRFDTRVSQLERMVAARPEELRAGCHVPTAMYETLPKNSCVLGAKKNEVDGLLIGDSFANHFTGMIDVMARSQGLSLMDYTMDGCPPILDYDNGKGSSYASKCLQRNREAYGFISAKHYKHVILAGSWPDTREAGEKLAKSVETLLQQGTMLTLIVNNESIAHGASCPIRRIMYKSAEPCNGTRHGAPKYIASIISKHPTVRVVDPNVVICSTTSCSPLINDKILYRDDVHLNDVGSREIGRELLTLGVLL